MIDFSKDAALSGRSDIRQSVDDRKVRQTNERNVHVDYDFANRDESSTSVAKDDVLVQSSVEKQVVEHSKEHNKKDKASNKYRRKFDKNMMTGLDVHTKRNDEFTK